MDEHAQSAQLELRVLTGLHQGAALLLIDEEVVLGSAPDCDVVLLDEGIAPGHLRILSRDTGWAWRAGGPGDGPGDPHGAVFDGAVFAPDGGPAGAQALLGRGSRLRIANVWIMLAGVADPWPMPAELLDWQRQSQEAAAAQAERLAQGGEGAAPRKARAFVLACVCLGLLGALLLANAMLLLQAKAEPAPERQGTSTAAAAAAAVAPVAGPQSLAPAQLRSAALALLAEHRLEDTVQVTAEPGQLQLHATLGPAGRANFERSLLALQRRFGATTRIEASVTSAEATLPFRIRQVLMGGGDSRVVLADGRAMYEGDRLGGYRLVSIREGVIVFAGPRKVEVPW